MPKTQNLTKTDSQGPHILGRLRESKVIEAKISPNAKRHNWREITNVGLSIKRVDGVKRYSRTSLNPDIERGGGISRAIVGRVTARASLGDVDVVPDKVPRPWQRNQ